MIAQDQQGTLSSPQRDRLTGLFLADEALSRVERWHGIAAQRGERAYVHAMLLQLRNFSAVNLAHGDGEGDRVLVEVAARLLHFARAELSGPFVVARVSGDTFLLAMDGAVSRDRWQWLAEELGRWIARPVVQAPGQGGPLPIRAPIRPPIRLRLRLALSRGIAGEGPARMLARLGETMDMQRGAAQGCPSWVDGALSPSGIDPVRLEADLAAAIEADAIAVAYQPQYSCTDGRITGAEALARWHHPVLGAVGPDALFAIAERADLTVQLAQSVLRAALAGARGWPAHLKLSLNVTAGDLFQRDFDQTVLSAALDAGFPTERLTLEITEGALVCDLERAARGLRRLTEAGMHVALDDFGAGFCNFRYLKMLPLHAIKLDRSMVEGVGEDPRDLAVLRGIVAMARALGLAVTAEGIETSVQRDIVAAEGCTTWQGFLGAEAMMPDAFTTLVADEACA